MLTIKDGFDEQMALFRKKNKGDAEVIIMLWAYENVTNGLTTTIKKNIDQLN